MLGRFRKANVLSKKKLGHIYDTAMKAVGKEPVIIKAIAGGFSDECKKLVEERYGSTSLGSNPNNLPKYN
nr:MAG: hypothetical protein [Bacteriophage sp.]